MATETAAMAQEAAHAKEIIHYFAQEWAPGVVIHMQTMYMTWVTMAIVFVLFFMASRNPKMVPSGIQNVMEFFVDFLNGVSEGILGLKGSRFMAPFIITLFMFILVGNEIGVLLPQVGVHWTSPTNDINTTFGLAILVSISVYVVGVYKNGLGHFKHFVTPSPAFLPLHLLEEFTKPLTLALRLFGNILAGEILLIVLYQLSPWIIPEFWVMFSLVIGFLQAFIFTMLALTSYAIIFAHH